MYASRLSERHRDQELTRTDRIRLKTPFSDVSVISHSVHDHLNQDCSGLWSEREWARNAKVHAPRVCESDRQQELSRTNPIGHKTAFFYGSRISNSVQYKLNRDQSGLWSEQESGKNPKVHAPRLWEGHRNQESEWKNTISHMTTYGSKISNSVQYKKDLSGPILEQEAERNAKRHMLEMKQALVQKQYEELHRRMDRMEEEIKISKLRAMLMTEKLKKDNYVSTRYEAGIYHTGSQARSEDKTSYVHIWQSSGHIMPQMASSSLDIKRPEVDTGNINKNVRADLELEGMEVPEPTGNNFRKKWLEESMQQLRTIDSQTSTQKSLKAPVRSLQHLEETGCAESTQAGQEDLPEEPKQARLEVQEVPGDHLRRGLLEASIKNLPEDYHEASQKDLKDSVEDPQRTRPELPELSRDHTKKGWLKASPENIRKNDSEISRLNVQDAVQGVIKSKKDPEASKRNLQESVEASIKNLQDQCPEESRKAKKEWLKISKTDLQEEGHQTSELTFKEWFKAPMRSLQELRVTGCEETIRNGQEDLPEEAEHTRLEIRNLPRVHLRKEWLKASIANLRRRDSEESTQKVKEGLQAVMSSFSKKGPEAPKQNIQVWLEGSIKNLQEDCPEESRRDMKKWLEISKSYLQKEGPETCQINAQEWLEACIKSIQDLQEKKCEVATQTGQEDLPEHMAEINLGVPDLPGDNLKEGWLQASIEKLKRGGSEASKINVQKWLQTSLMRLREGPETAKKNLKGWLEASIKSLSEESSEESTQDVKEWLEVSASCLQKKGPETSKLNVEEWLHVSMSSIQELQNHEASEHNLQVREHEVSTIDVRASMERTNLLEQRLQRSSKDEWDRSHQVSASCQQKQGPETSKLNGEEGLHVSTSSIQELQNREASEQNLHVREREVSMIDVRPSMERTNLLEQSLQRSSEVERCRSHQTESSAASKQNVGKRLQLSSDVDSCEMSSRSMLDWRSESRTTYEGKHLEIPSQPPGVRLVKSTGDLQAVCPKSSALRVGGELLVAIPRVRKGASKLRVQEWLESSSRSLEAAGPEASKQSLQQWLEDSVRTLDETCPASSRHDVQEWLQASLSKVKEPNAYKHGAQEWIRASLINLREEGPEVPLRDVVEYLQGSINDLQEEASRLSVQEWLEASLRKLQEEDPQSSRDDVKEWLESSLRKFRAVSPQTSGHCVKKWLERSLGNLHKPKQNLQEYLKESVMRLRAGSFAASKLRHNMDWLKVPQSTTGARDSGGKFKHRPSRTHTDEHGASKTTLIFKESEADLQEEERPDISEIFINSEGHPKIQKQRGSKGKQLDNQSGSNTKTLITKVSEVCFQFRTPFMIFLILLIIFVLITLAYRHYQLYCSPCRGLRPF